MSASSWISIKRRDSEGEVSAYRQRISNELGLVDIQGLLIGDNDRFTGVVEAFEINANEPNLSLCTLFDPRDLFIKAKMAEELQIPFSIWAHAASVPDALLVEKIEIGENGFDLCVAERCRVLPQVFISWWKSKKKTHQTKRFNEDYIKDSYFDKLLSEQGLSWGGNIDGIYYDEIKGKIAAIVEVRCTKKKPIESYDPSAFIKKDRHTWEPVLQLSDRLSVPCILLTFAKSYKPNEAERYGVAVVEGMNSGGLNYRNGEPPYQHFMTTASELADFIRRL